MKATGVVRRIDDLGRVVIPKEIRRNYKINEGDSLEIFVDSNGLILKKFSALDDMEKLASLLVEIIFKVYQKILLITDKDKVIATPKTLVNNYLGDELNPIIKDNIEDREVYHSTIPLSITINNKTDSYLYMYPIIVNSDVVGSIILLENTLTFELEQLINFIMLFLIKNIEE